MTTPIDEQIPRKSPSTFTWIVALPLLAVLLVAPFVFLALYDAPTPNDTILTPCQSVSPVEQLYQPHLTEFSSTAAQLQWTSISNFDSDSLDLTSEEAQLLTSHQELLEKFDRVLALSPNSWTWPNQQVRSKTGEAYPSRFDLRAAIELQLRQSKSDLQTKGIESAVRRCLHLIRFTHKLRGNPATYEDLCHSMAAQTSVEEFFQRLIRRPDTPASLLQESLTTLRPLVIPSRDELILGIQLNYQEFKSLINDPVAQRQTIEDFSGRSPERSPKVKVNQCLALWMTDTEPVVQALSHSWTDGLQAAARLPTRKLETSWFERVHAHLTWNYDGRFFHQIGSIDPGTTPLNFMERDRIHQVNLLMLALRLHELRHGALPSHLEELVPETLPEQPIDIFSSRQFSWDMSSETITSQGTHPFADVAYWWRKGGLPTTN